MQLSKDEVRELKYLLDFVIELGQQTPADAALRQRILEEYPELA